MVRFSVLDLAPVSEGSDASSALSNSLDLARHAEALGYRRFWLAEHHNMPGIASSATPVLVGHIAGGTTSIRVGAGGVMLPNHAPLVVAEQFGTLEALYPGRIDLGLGRAPGTDQATARALRRAREGGPGEFPADVAELIGYFADPAPGQRVRALPGAGRRVPVWILGSSLHSAELAARLGLPYAFASHFAPHQLKAALERYRSRFEPSEPLDAPYVMLGVNIVAADTEDEARTLMSTMEKAFVSLRRGEPATFQPPEPAYRKCLAPAERDMLDEVLACSAIGSVDTVHRALGTFVAHTGADELIVATTTYAHEARLRSYELTARVAERLNQ